eukprot:scaffold25863_cov75-Phaeocystis_antarctica.AAC.2
MLRVVLVHNSILSVLGPARRAHAVHGGGEEAAKDEAEHRLDDREHRVGFGRRAAGRVAVGHSVAGQPEDEADGGKPRCLGKKPAHVLRARRQAWRCRVSRSGTLGGGQWEKAATKRRAGAVVHPAPRARSQAGRQAGRQAGTRARRRPGGRPARRPGGRAGGWTHRLPTKRRVAKPLISVACAPASAEPHCSTAGFFNITSSVSASPMISTRHTLLAWIRSGLEYDGLRICGFSLTACSASSSLP